MNKKTTLTLTFFLLLFNHFSWSAESSLTLEQFAEICVDSSKDLSNAKQDTAVLSENLSLLRQLKNVPKVDLGFSYQNNTYDNLKDDGTGHLISNNGYNRSDSLTISYDTQLLISPDLSVAQEKLANSETNIDLVKDQTKYKVIQQYYGIQEINNELTAYKSLLESLNKIEGVLNRQQKLGVDNSLERQQFKLLKNSTTNEFQTRKIDLDNSYIDLSSLVGIIPTKLKDLVARVETSDAPLTDSFLAGLKPKTPSSLSPAIKKSLHQDETLKKIEIDNTSSFPAPSVYLKISRDRPTMFSADGPQTSTEVGISFPLDSFFIKRSQKTQLAAELYKNSLISQQQENLLNDQLASKVEQLKYLINQHAELISAEELSENMLDNSFLYYSQKKIDPLGAADIFQKYLQSKKNRFMNETQIMSLQLEIQYLNSGGTI